MGGSSMIDDNWVSADSVNADRTVVLVGKTGNGKSSTANSILGRKSFRSKASSGGVTMTCEMESTVLIDGRPVNVIDTPGLFDVSTGSEIIGKEIVKCIEWAKYGIHAVLVVFSVRSRFSEEEVAAIYTLQRIFGKKIIEYMILVFTGGDDLEAEDETLEDYIGCNCSVPLQRIFELCKQRVVLFDNKTMDETKKENQVGELFSLVDSVVAANSGQPFSDELFTELKNEALRMHNEEREVEALNGCTKEHISELKDQIYKSYDDQLFRIASMVEEKLKETVERLEKQLDESVKELKIAQEAKKKSDEEIRKLSEDLDGARRNSEEFRVRAERNNCAIL